MGKTLEFVNEEVAEKIGHDIVDKCDNLLAAASLPLPAEIHLEGMKEGLKEIRETAISLHRLIAGNDPWEE